VRKVEAQVTSNISGTVRDSNGDPVGNARVGIFALGRTFDVTISDGTYAISGVPHSAGPYDVQLLAPCTRDQVKRVVVDGPETVNFTIPAQDKSAGYRCTHTVFPQYIPGTTQLLEGDDESTVLPLPFPFPFFGTSYTSFRLHTNGFINFEGGDPGSPPHNQSLPDANAFRPNAAIYAFWDDLNLDAGRSITRTTTEGTSPNRFFVIEWFNATFFDDPTRRLSFEIVLFEDGRIALQYKDISVHSQDLRERGSSATVGIENRDGTAAVQRLFNQPYLDNGFGIEFAPATK
jgi:hypothetical protein